MIASESSADIVLAVRLSWKQYNFSEVTAGEELCQSLAVCEAVTEFFRGQI